MARVPIDAGLFTDDADAPRLVGSRCRECGEVTFPRQDGCPCCTGSAMEEVLLARRGTLWTFTIQRFPPPMPPFKGDPASFTPFGVGYVELADGLRVEGRLTENDPEKLAIGMEMELVLERFQNSESGEDLTTFAFRPVG
ncbi:MAG: Zn-ribbon domain-containing OB-fold protein [Myxococcota bacterium]